MNVEPAPNAIVAVGAARFGNALPLALIAGPCALESRDHAFEMAAGLKEIAGKIGIGFVYKTSFDKANRTSAKSNRGIGLDGALPIFADIRQRFGVPVLTDVHETAQCARVAEVADVLQIPAFLCRQTDLLVAAAATGRVVNIKKGQFLAPWDMANVVGKVTAAGNANVLVTERGAVMVDAFKQNLTVYSHALQRPAWAYWGSDSNQGMVEEFVQAIREQRPPQVSGVDGLRAVEVVEAAYRSLESGQPVKL